MSLNNPTTCLSIERQASASNANTWGDRANANFQRIDQAIAQSVSIAVTVADVTLTTTDTGDLNADAQSRYFNLELSGALTGNRNVIVPATARLYRVNNSCSGAFTVTLKTSGGTGVAVPQGGALMLWCDATNVVEHQTPTSAAVTKVFWGGTSGGSANAQTVTLAPVPTAYGTGMPIRFLAGSTNTTGAPTLNVNGLGAKTITRWDGSTLRPNEIVSGATLDVVYDGTNFRKMQPDWVKAWVQFFLTGTTPTINGSYNVTSVTRNSAGNYTIAFTNALTLTYAVLGTVDNVAAFNQVVVSTYATTSITVATINSARTSGDFGANLNVLVIGG